MLSTFERLLRSSAKAPSSECRIWTGYTKKNGYGEMSYLGKRSWVHRVAYETFCGEIPAGKHVCHKCDVRNCINPQHLFLGTNLDNIKDRHAKGREALGVRHGLSKLTEDAVKEIRSTHKQTKSLAEKYGVHRTLIQQVRRGKIWTHVE